MERSVQLSRHAGSVAVDIVQPQGNSKLGLHWVGFREFGDIIGRMGHVATCLCLLSNCSWEMCYVLFCMDCGVFSKAPQGLVGSPCNALILLPHSLPTPPTPAMAPPTLANTHTKCRTLHQQSVASAPLLLLLL